MKRFCIAVLVLGASAAPAAAIECNVNVLSAHLTALKRGWLFDCRTYVGTQMVLPPPAKFATYPPDKIGCSMQTAPVVMPLTTINGRFFKNYQVAGPAVLRNGWSVESFEISGKQYTAYENEEYKVFFGTTELAANNSYNIKLSKLVLKKNGGNCAKAIDEAF
jgi:hypothetical protein